ncbi:MAG: fibronectin type III domain-containing protein [Gemmatimonadaceae bacterium]|nr:fibronectin type III domain-containing protein [Gemmatimonadaceae bacterium]
MKRPGFWCIAAMVAAVACHDSTGPRTLGVPGGLSAAATSANSIRLSWSRASNADSYVVQRALATGDFADVGTTSGTRFDDTSLEPSTTYRYRVAARRSSTTSAWAGPVEGMTLATGRGTAQLSGDITASRTLTADTLYVLHGPVRVRAGAVLRIGAGTKIVGDTNVVGSSLLIDRGAKIYAEGSGTHPIVFTSQRAPGRRRPGEWGGLSIVGNARINLQVRNIQTEGPPGGTVDYAGGTNDDDDSGVLRFVRIEFAGARIGPNEKMNSLSLYAVGRKTTLEYIETLAGLDDGIKWFGGTVNGRFLVVYEPQDDALDVSQGYSGQNQYVIAVMSTVIDGYDGTGSDDRNFLESDGCEAGVTGCPSNFDAAPYSMPFLANFVAIGPWNWDVDRYGGNGILLRRGSGATLVNGVVARWPKTGLTIRDDFTETMRQRDSITIRNVFMTQNGADFDPSGAFYGQREKFAGASIEESTLDAASLFVRYEPSTGTFDWDPAGGSPIAHGGMTPFTGRVAARAGSAIFPTAYRGVTGAGGLQWWQGWTYYARN